jgi:hypothetical protein
MIEFDNGRVTEVLRACLIIVQQQEMIDEVIPDIADEFGVSKGSVKKICMAYAKDTLQKTQEKLEDERSMLANIELLIEAVENISPSDIKEVYEESDLKKPDVED